MPAGREPFALWCAVSPLHGREALAPAVDSFVAALRALGGRDWRPGTGPPAAPLVVLVATGGTERPILDAVAPLGAALLVAHPGHNSLPAALEALAALRAAGARAAVHALRAPDDREGLAALAAAVRGHSVRGALRASRIGLLGGPSEWLVASRPDPETVRATWGPTVVPLPMDPLLAEPDPAAAAEGGALARQVLAGAAGRVEPSEAEVVRAAAVHASLRRVVRTERLDAVAVRCFDLVARCRTTGCLALARLNDEGVTAGCEGDLVATLVMLWTRLLLGTVPWMANPARADAATGRLVLAHCTVPRGAAGPWRLRSHFESGLGVAVQAALPAGPVTLVRIGGARLERLRAIEGALLGSPEEPDLCRTQAEVEVGTGAVRELLADPLGNHLVLVPGRHAAALRRWHEAMIA